jgi:hypothetical protein
VRSLNMSPRSLSARIDVELHLCASARSASRRSALEIGRAGTAEASWTSRSAARGSGSPVQNVAQCQHASSWHSIGA